MITKSKTFLAALTISTALPAQADWKDSLYLDLYGGLSFIGGTDVTQGGLSSDAEFDSGIMTGARFGYQLNPEWSFEIEYIYRRNDLDSISGGPFGAATDGDYASTAVMFNAIYTFTNLEQETFGINWRPYAGLGLGFLTEADIDFETGGIESEYSDDLLPAAQIILGLNFDVVSNWSIFTELRYTFAGELELSDTSGPGELTADYGGASALIGLRYNF